MLGVLFGLLLALASLPAEEEEAAADDVRARELPEIEKEVAKQHVAAFREAFRASRALNDQLAALDLLVQGRHEEVSKELRKLVGERPATVQLRAIQLLGTQPDDVARKALLGLARPGRKFDPVRGAEAVRSLGYIGYGKDFDMLEELFFENGTKEVRKAILEAVGRQQEKEAVALILAVLDQPVPKNPNDPANPPADWWRDKYEEWLFFKEDAITALASITGRRFYNRAEAVEWIESEEGREAGFRLRRVPAAWV